VPTPNPAATPLRPANPGSNPVDLLAWLFTPIFQILFILLVALDQLVDNVAVAIILLTIVIRIVLIPLFRRQTVSQKRMQLVQSEVREIQRRYKGDRLKASEAQQRFYAERGINPASGCLPILLQFVLLIPMYSVISGGLTNTDPNAMLNLFGVQLFQLSCDPTPVIQAGNHVKPCLDTVVAGVDMGRPELLFGYKIPGTDFGLSGLALISAVLQLIQSRMMLPPMDPKNDDPNVRIQRQMMLFLPLISIVYGAFLPSGLFVYWIVTTIFSIVQQYLIIGFGSLFPFLGRYPSFAKDHTPRFPVMVPAPDPSRVKTPGPSHESEDRQIKAARTVRPRERGRQGRRGRRR
jgi:YidC/Oxa1 family membrane protein insertase